MLMIVILHLFFGDLSQNENFSEIKPPLVKDLLKYGQNTQIVHLTRYGALKNPYSCTETQYFFEKKDVKILSCA